ncbi:serine/threonine protein phosphatase [Thiohalobacter thiocyanaticus]|uniref:Serine/threonine protein phosphatase n=1 Tax=Thiohalobacter thiocyanaticus TaxID=585455 RepID=A0A1Z4VQV7_9GAMM|nr:PP2C family protein-serine/threonine phosphatase [Thiohalobacter thiocyanaticus]BAZ93792.1 serine/threonine protein phosphatase [Thiohalobacter thiocyanaticus]
MEFHVYQNRGQRPLQEDRYVVTPLFDGTLIAVLDGHGGPGIAEDCALALPGLLQRALEELDRDETPPTAAFRRVIAELVARYPSARDVWMNDTGGTTLSAAFIEDDRITTAVLGDSPILLRIDGEDWIAPAHNVELNPKDVARIEAAHQDQIMRGELHIDSSHLRLASWTALALTRAIGDRDFARYLIREPEVETHPLTPESEFNLILATDGIQVSTDSETLEAHYTDLLDRVAAGGSAADLGRQHANDPRTSDNLTIITACRHGDGGSLRLPLHEHQGMKYARVSDLPRSVRESLNQFLLASAVPSVPGVPDAAYPQDVLSWERQNGIKVQFDEGEA